MNLTLDPTTDSIMGRLDKKVIILTAAAQGIGRAAAIVSYRLLLFAH